MITTTRTDCERDNKAVKLPNASTLGYGLWKAKRGHWVSYEADNAHFVGRVIGRVVCENTVYVEVAQAAEGFSCAYVRWVKPEQIRECRAVPPKSVFDFFTGEWSNVESIHAALAYGVSDMKDQQAAPEHN